MEQGFVGAPARRIACIVRMLIAEMRESARAVRRARAFSGI